MWAMSLTGFRKWCLRHASWVSHQRQTRGFAHALAICFALHAAWDDMAIGQNWWLKIWRCSLLLLHGFPCFEHSCGFLNLWIPVPSPPPTIIIIIITMIITSSILDMCRLLQPSLYCTTIIITMIMFIFHLPIVEEPPDLFQVYMPEIRCSIPSPWIVYLKASHSPGSP